MPANVLLVGGGVIGCEYASFLSAVGVKVEIAEILDSMLFGEDEEAVRTLGREFKKKGILVHEKTRVDGDRTRRRSVNETRGTGKSAAPMT